MWRIQERFGVEIGGNTYVNTPDLVVYDDHPLLRVYRCAHNGNLGIDLDIHDHRGAKIAEIRENILTAGESDRYFVNVEAGELTVTDTRTGHILLSLTGGTGLAPVLKAQVRIRTPEGCLLEATPSRTNLGQQAVSGCFLQDWSSGISITATKDRHLSCTAMARDAQVTPRIGCAY